MSDIVQLELITQIDERRIHVQRRIGQGRDRRKCQRLRRQRRPDQSDVRRIDLDRGAGRPLRRLRQQGLKNRGRIRTAVRLRCRRRQQGRELIHAQRRDAPGIQRNRFRQRQFDVACERNRWHFNGCRQGCGVAKHEIRNARSVKAVDRELNHAGRLADRQAGRRVDGGREALASPRPAGVSSPLCRMTSAVAPVAPLF